MDEAMTIQEKLRKGDPHLGAVCERAADTIDELLAACKELLHYARNCGAENQMIEDASLAIALAENEGTLAAANPDAGKTGDVEKVALKDALELAEHAVTAMQQQWSPIYDNDPEGRRRAHILGNGAALKFQQAMATIRSRAPQLDPRGAEQWRPIETAPMHTDVIVAFSTIVGEARCLATSAGPQWFWANTDPSDHWANAIYPTHWQPLPPSPIAAADRSHP